MSKGQASKGQASRDPVEIVLNGDRRRVPDGITALELLGLLELAPGMVVVERNRTILARDALAATPVEPGDQIELVHFVGGG